MINVRKDVKTILLITVTMFFLFSLVKNTKVFYWDSALYWNLANSFMVDGDFSIGYFPNSYRGYLYPLLLYIFTKLGYFIGDPNIGLVVFNSIVSSVSIVFIYLILECENYLSKTRLILGSFSHLFFDIFFGDLILYPLSDIPAFAFFVSSVYLSKRWIEGMNNNRRKNYLLVTTIGFLIYAAYNTRTIYIYPSLVLIINIFIKFNIIQKKILKNILALFLPLLIGISIAGLPQSIINKIHNDTYYPMVMTEKYSGNQNLFLKQLNWGITYSKYETYVGEESQYSSPGVKFKDNTGERIIGLEGGEYPQSIGEWFALVLRYPLDFMGIFGRHIISYITPTYSEVYIKNLNINKTGIISINIGLYIILVLSILTNYNEELKRKLYSIKKEFNKNIWIWICLLPCIFIIPGAPEVRFFIPLYIYIYVYISFFTDFKNIYLYVKRRPISYILACAGIYVIWITLIGGILALPADPNYIFTIK